MGHVFSKHGYTRLETKYRFIIYRMIAEYGECIIHTGYWEKSYKEAFDAGTFWIDHNCSHDLENVLLRIEESDDA